MSPVYQVATPCTQCSVCLGPRRPWFVTGFFQAEYASIENGRRAWRYEIQTDRICGPLCAEHWATYHEGPMYDRHGRNIREWLVQWRADYDRRIARRQGPERKLRAA